uniref:Mediator of RNA polymerase II transcription subunit 20 n=1 Tax=Timema californicum TaxID=61474 RepID=A0A7R9JBH8_TIMCA|nr:unnamed protein product [Timema californicum]
MKVEYKPCVVPASCWDLMREFLQGFLGSSVQNTAPQYLQNRINEVYQPIDTIQQYLDQFMLYRKATGVLTTNPTAINLSFIDQSRYLFIQVSPHLSSRGQIDPDPDRFTENLEAPGIESTTSGSLTWNSNH